MQKAIWEMTLLCELHLPFFSSHQSPQFVRGNHLLEDKDKDKGKEVKDKGKEDKDKEKTMTKMNPNMYKKRGV